MRAKSELPADGVFILGENAISNRKNSRVGFRILAQQFKAFVETALPFLICAGNCFEICPRIIKIKNFAIRFSFAGHFFRASLTQAHAVSGTFSGNENFAGGVSNIIKIAADFIPAEFPIDGKTKRRSGKQKTRWISSEE